MAADYLALTLYAATGIQVGSNVLIGINVAIYDTDFHSLETVRVGA